MAMLIDIPGLGRLELEHLLLDVNGTLSDRGRLISGVAERLAALAGRVDVRLLTADTFGTARELAQRLGVPVQVVADQHQKREVIEALGAHSCVAIGNGANDVPMLAAARLGIAVMGPEGVATAALNAADIACGSIIEALDLLSDPDALAATLRP